MFTNINAPSAPFPHFGMIALAIMAMSTIIVQSHGVICDSSLQGFATLGAGTTGGSTASPITVTNIDEMRKACVGNNPAVVKVSGTISTGPVAVLIGSNKSIIGLDGSVIHGGLEMAYGTTNVIIRYLKIKGAGDKSLPKDAISARGTTNIWVDHCDLSDTGDRLVEMTKGSDLITISWNTFWYSERVNRTAISIGESPNDGNLDRGKLRVTFHHNHFSNNLSGGMALVRFGQAHFANNFYNAPGNLYAIGVGTESQLFIENNLFAHMNNPISTRDNNTAAYVTETGNIYTETGGDKCTGPIQGGATPFTKPPYALHLDPATEVKTLVMACAHAKVF